MTAREQAKIISDAAQATLNQLPASVLEILRAERIAVIDLAKALANNAAQTLQALQEEEES
jgi:hypothetical protein